jgi:uncharacterized protein YkwD
LHVLINDIRGKNGLAPLTPVIEMTTASSNLAGEMFQRGSAGHYDSGWREEGGQLVYHRYWCVIFGSR